MASCKVVWFVGPWCIVFICCRFHVFNCRYFIRVLLAKKAIPAESLPLYFESWIQKGSDLCMYTSDQLKKFNEKHLEFGAWYLDCNQNFTPSTELAVRQAIDGGEFAVNATDDVSDEEPPEPPKQKKKRETKKEKAAREKLEKEQHALAEKEAAEKERLEKERAEKERADKLNAESEALAANQIEEKAAVDHVDLSDDGEDDDDEDREGPTYSRDTAAPQDLAQEECRTPLVHDSSVSNAVYVTAQRLRKKKQGVFTSTSSSAVEHESLQVYLECTNVKDLLELGANEIPDPRWKRLQDCIAQVMSSHKRVSLI